MEVTRGNSNVHSRTSHTMMMMIMASCWSVSRVFNSLVYILSRQYILIALVSLCHKSQKCYNVVRIDVFYPYAGGSRCGGRVINRVCVFECVCMSVVDLSVL